jgi:hypothetical protein
VGFLNFFHSISPCDLATSVTLGVAVLLLFFYSIQSLRLKRFYPKFLPILAITVGLLGATSYFQGIRSNPNYSRISSSTQTQQKGSQITNPNNSNSSNQTANSSSKVLGEETDQSIFSSLALSTFSSHITGAEIEYLNGDLVIHSNGDIRLAPDSVYSRNIPFHAIKSSDLDGGAITSRTIKDGTIDSKDLDETITIEHLTVGNEFNLGKYLSIGDGEPSHFTLDQGDFYATGRMEVDGNVYFDKTLYVRDSSSISTMTSNTLQTQTANISNILSNSNLKIKGRLPHEDNFSIDDFVTATINPFSLTAIGADASLIFPAHANGAGDLYVANNLEVGGVIYGTISGAYSPSGDLDMANHIITNIGNTGTDFTASGGLILAGNLILGANTLTTTNETLVSHLNADLLNEQHGSYY